MSGIKTSARMKDIKNGFLPVLSLSSSTFCAETSPVSEDDATSGDLVSDAAVRANNFFKFIYAMP
jgi:hypothetical protein